MNLIKACRTYMLPSVEVTVFIRNVLLAKRIWLHYENIEKLMQLETK